MSLPDDKGSKVQTEIVSNLSCQQLLSSRVGITAQPSCLEHCMLQVPLYSCVFSASVIGAVSSLVLNRFGHWAGTLAAACFMPALYICPLTSFVSSQTALWSTVPYIHFSGSSKNWPLITVTVCHSGKYFRLEKFSQILSNDIVKAKLF